MLQSISMVFHPYIQYFWNREEVPWVCRYIWIDHQKSENSRSCSLIGGQMKENTLLWPACCWSDWDRFCFFKKPVGSCVFTVARPMVFVQCLFAVYSFFACGLKSNCLVPTPMDDVPARENLKSLPEVTGVHSLLYFLSFYSRDNPIYILLPVAHPFQTRRN